MIVATGPGHAGGELCPSRFMPQQVTVSSAFSAQVWLRPAETALTEANLNQLEMSTGFTTADFFQVQTQFTRYNMLGSARRVTVQSTVSNLGAGQLNGSGIFHDVTSGARDSIAYPISCPLSPTRKCHIRR